jgi:Cof subfamily protein (haloacid dehalogenase superfamily)
MPVRLLASDLDGTLLRSDGTVSSRTRAAVDAAADAGIELIIVTGRPPRWVRPLVDQLGDRGLVICANGASVYDPARHEVVSHQGLDPESAAEVVRRLKERWPELSYAVEQELTFGWDPAYNSRYRPAPGSRQAPIEELVREPVTKLLARHAAPAPHDLAEQASELLGELAAVTHSDDPSLLEISSPGVHKAATLERLAAERGIGPHEVIAFGDMPNDLQLLGWAGHGVAVANAHPTLLEAADEVTASNDEDGVALVIERVLAEGA